MPCASKIDRGPLQADHPTLSSSSSKREATLLLPQRNSLWTGLSIAVDPKPYDEAVARDEDPQADKPFSSTKSHGHHENDDEGLSLPWSETQEWALRDKLPQYTIHVPLVKDGKEIMTKCALWKTMSNEVTEISGYPVDFLREMNKKQVASNAKNDTISADGRTVAEDFTVRPPEVLPYLDLYEFSSSGGTLGNVYGVPGLADGTRVETSPVDNVQDTLPKGYIRTADGSTAYELGRPVQPSENEAVAEASKFLLKRVVNSAPALSTSTSSEPKGENEDMDRMLVRAGASAGILLAAAAAVDILSHHLTLNFFWV